nr:MAG TPA: hypothetical protein [Caudoviricetes sp.]DAY70593.1 MAG TPA: hypothetical protein [Caudoviricetes sp.]
MFPCYPPNTLFKATLLPFVIYVFTSINYIPIYK